MARKITTESFIKKAVEIHGGKYDYGKVVYVSARTPVLIACHEHGEFMQTPHAHVWGKGCPKCGLINRSKSRKTNIDDFITKANAIHGGKYDYHKVEYVRTHDKVCIICPVHGEFWQRPSGHLRGMGCYDCTHAVISQDEFLSRARDAHGDKYDYHLVNYQSAKSEVTIICPIHGEFRQIAHSHSMLKAGCVKCSNNGPSRTESGLFQFVQSICPDAYQSDRTIIKPKELDIVIPSHNLAIEFNGLYWHSERTKDKQYHIDKRRSVEAAGYTLISIREDLWNNRNSHIKRIIMNAVGMTSRRVFARKCQIVTVSTYIAKAFLNDNHVQGFRGSSCHYGLECNGELVSVMGVTHWRNRDEWELVRYATSCSVVGGLSKLWKHVVNMHDVTRAYSYVDRDLFTGKSYDNAGFVCDSTSVGFRIVNGCTTESRQKWNKAPESMTQSEWYKAENVARIYDSGQDKLIFLRNNE